jgi:choline dehydrogenase-like flavoprotein
MTGKRYDDSTVVDFVVVGSGAAGGVIARELAIGGFSTVVLEQGPRLTPADFEHDELKYWFLSGITNDPARSPQTFRADPAATAVPTGMRPALWYARTVGGSSTHFTANYWRFHEIDFVERSCLGSIAGTGFEDWPITYAELEPYYTKVEWDIGVCGLAGASPFDPPRSRPYPMPPLPVKSSGVLLERGARKLGLHPFPAPMAINSQPHRGRPACIHCGFCHGFACEAQAKSSTLFNMIPEAEATGRCEVRPNSYVVRIDTDAHGRATGVAYFDAHGRERFQKARAVVVSANGAETPRLLLASESSRFPDGLANSSGLVGKYLMFNGSSRLSAVFEHELNEFKSVQVTRVVHDFYDCDPKRGFYGGGGIDARIGPQPAIWAQRLSTEGPALGCRLQGAPARVPAFVGVVLSRYVITCGYKQREPGSNAQGCVGKIRDTRHLQGPSRRSRQCTFHTGPRGGDHGGSRSTACHTRTDPGADLLAALAGHVSYGSRSSYFSYRPLSSHS